MRERFRWNSLLITLPIILLLGATQVFACTCIFDGSPVEKQVEKARTAATAVFLGEVVGFEYRKGIPNEHRDKLVENGAEPVEYETKVIKFRVDRWWKGMMGFEAFMITSDTRTANSMSFSMCELSFKLNERYLVYAHGPEDQLKAHSCARYLPLQRAGEDLSVLGEGKIPAN